MLLLIILKTQSTFLLLEYALFFIGYWWGDNQLSVFKQLGYPWDCTSAVESYCSWSITVRRWWGKNWCCFVTNSSSNNTVHVRMLLWCASIYLCWSCLQSICSCTGKLTCSFILLWRKEFLIGLHLLVG